MPAPKSQHENRRYETFRDKFGRFYGANVELSTGDPCEVLMPQGWRTPTPVWAKPLLLPPLDDREICRMVPRHLRAQKGYELEIDFARWLMKWDAANERHLKKIADYARGMAAKGGQSIAQLVENPTPELLFQVGPGPMPPREFIVAMAAGNQWALMRSDRVPAKAQAILDRIKPVVMKRTEATRLDIDPFAEDSDELEAQRAHLAGQLEDAVRDPLEDDEDDRLEELEEQYDPKETGGRRVPVGAGAGKVKPPKQGKKPPKEE